MNKAAFGSALLAFAAIAHAETTVESFGKDEKKIRAVLDDCKNRAVNVRADTADAQRCRAAKTAMRDLVIQPYKATHNGKKF